MCNQYGNSIIFPHLLKHLKTPFLFIICNLALIAHNYGVGDWIFKSLVPGSLPTTESFCERWRGETVLCLAIFVLSNRKELRRTASYNFPGKHTYKVVVIKVIKKSIEKNAS